jgi:hypothetical protein
MGVRNILDVGHTRVEILDDAFMIAREQHLSVCGPSHCADGMLVCCHQFFEFVCVTLRDKDKERYLDDLTSQRLNSPS